MKLRQSVWLLLACFCVVFSGAMKKVLQLHADQKISLLIHIDNDGTHPSQNIKDGHRERHEIQTIVLSDKKQFPAPGFHPSLHLSSLQISPALLNLHTWACSSVSYESQRAVSSGPVPEYLLFRKLLV